MTRIAAGVAGGMMAEGARQLRDGNRPRLKDMLLTPQNAQRISSELAKLRGAAMKLGQMLSMDAGDVIPKELDQHDLNATRQLIDVEHHILAPIQKRLHRYPIKRINFVYDIKLANPVKAPRREFSQAIAHLADNAFKFSPEHGQVSLKVRSGENGGATITIQDEGIGIPVALREKVFERFYQVSKGDQREFQGLGVGLTV